MLVGGAADEEEEEAAGVAVADPSAAAEAAAADEAWPASDAEETLLTIVEERPLRRRFEGCSSSVAPEGVVGVAGAAAAAEADAGAGDEISSAFFLLRPELFLGDDVSRVNVEAILSRSIVRLSCNLASCRAGFWNLGSSFWFGICVSCSLESWLSRKRTNSCASCCLNPLNLS